MLSSFTISADLVLTIPYMFLMELEIKHHFCLSVNTCIAFPIKYMSFKDIGKLFEKQETWARVTYYRARKKIMEVMENEDNL